jgi:hypothetical protein
LQKGEQVEIAKCEKEQPAVLQKGLEVIASSLSLIGHTVGLAIEVGVSADFTFYDCSYKYFPGWEALGKCTSFFVNMHSDEDLLSELFQSRELHNYYEAFLYQLSRLYTENPNNLGFPHRPLILLTKFAVLDN